MIELYHNDMSVCAIAFRYQKLAIGVEEAEKFHQKMPYPVKRERS